MTRQSGVALLMVSLYTTSAAAQFLETNVKTLLEKEVEKTLLKEL
jgi:hypothetical protein